MFFIGMIWVWLLFVVLFFMLKYGFSEGLWIQMVVCLLMWLSVLLRFIVVVVLFLLAGVGLIVVIRIRLLFLFFWRDLIQFVVSLVLLLLYWVRVVVGMLSFLVMFVMGSMLVVWVILILLFKVFFFFEVIGQVSWCVVLWMMGSKWFGCLVSMVCNCFCMCGFQKFWMCCLILLMVFVLEQGLKKVVIWLVMVIRC